MEEKDRQKINNIIYQLNAITRELDSLSYGIANEFEGIGASYCAKGIRTLSERYRYVKNELNKIE